MGIETGLLAASVGSSIYSGIKKGQAQKKNEKAATAAYKDNSGFLRDAQGRLATPGSAETGLEGYLSQLLGGDNFNSSQDALMQMINRSAADQLGNAGTQLDDLATNGGQQNVDNLLKALGIQQTFATDDQAARLNAQSSGLGQLAGTASRIGEARLRGQAQRDNNVINAGIQNTAMENAQNRRLAAAGQLGQLNLGAGQLNLGAAGALSQLFGIPLAGYGELGQLQGQRQGQQNDILRLMLANQAPQIAGGSPTADALGEAANSAFLLRRLGLGGTKAPVPVPAYTGAGSWSNPVQPRF